MTNHTLALKPKVLFLFTLSAILSLLISLSAVAGDDPVKKSSLRAFIAASLNASIADDKESPKLFREVLAKHPEILEWMSDPKAFDVALKEANLGAFSKEAAGEEILKKTIYGKIDGVWKKVYPEIAAKAGINLSAIPVDLNEIANEKNLQIALAACNKVYAKMPEEERLKLLNQVPDEAFREIDKGMTDYIQKLKVSDIEGINNFLKSDVFHKAKPEQRALLEGFMTGYFDKLPYEDKAGIMMGLMELAPDAPSTKQISVLVHKGGIVFQKAIQLFARDTTDEALQKVLEDAHQDLDQSLFEKDIRQQFKRVHNLEIEQYFKEFEMKPLAIATTGQVHKATLKDGTVVAVKFRKLNLLERAKREVEVIKEVSSGYADRKEIIEKFSSKLFEELNYVYEGFYTDVFENVYQNDALSITTITRDKGLLPAEDLIVYKFAEGKKISKFKEGSELITRAKALNTMLAHWFDIAMYQPQTMKNSWNTIVNSKEWKALLAAHPLPQNYQLGITGFHGDLHPGNLYMALLGAEAKTTMKENGFLITLLDFGNVAFLTTKQRRAFVKLSLATITDNQARIYESLSDIAEIGSKHETELKTMISTVLTEEKMPMKRANKILGLSLKIGVGIPDDYYSFVRGRAMLEREAEEINELLTKLHPQRKDLLIDAKTVYKKVSLKRILSIDGMVKKVFSQERRKVGTITPKLMTQFIVDYGAKLWNSMFMCGSRMKKLGPND